MSYVGSIKFREIDMPSFPPLLQCRLGKGWRIHRVHGLAENNACITVVYVIIEKGC